MAAELGSYKQVPTPARRRSPCYGLNSRVVEGQLQPLSRSCLVPEPKLCVEVSPTISSRYLSCDLLHFAQAQAPFPQRESIIRAVGDLLTKMEKPSGESSSYRRLQLFSGTLPTPAGEEALEHWLEHARLMVEESDYSAKEKRRRIMECLKGPALAMMKAARDTDPDVSPAQCLEAIESAFGSAETELLSEIRSEQEYESSRMKLNSSVRRVQANADSDSREGEIQSLKSDIKELRAMLTAMTATNSQTGNGHANCAAKKSEVIAQKGDIPPGMIGPPSLVPIKVNGEQCDALLDSSSQVTIIFEDWYKLHLPHVPILPVSGLAVWGLSDASYPYLGYVVMDMGFPENVTGVKKTITVLTLICPSSQSPEQSPVILGTNANMFRRLAQLCQDTAGVDIGQTSVSLPNQLTLDGEEDGVGSVKWMGPGSLNLPPGHL
ncbi:hypothetical protein L3Q82_006512 [Scortum barcoo]|uniref:Uncharacterized protein n=1 Tax=Scortum barcoo TaxID=214431 RepID=A0ACB8WZD8_9TELE|nr:hypothetical protein L3Q82_006512 [Scortum barcoo]